MSPVSIRYLIASALACVGLIAPIAVFLASGPDARGLTMGSASPSLWLISASLGAATRGVLPLPVPGVREPGTPTPGLDGPLGLPTE